MFDFKEIAKQFLLMVSKPLDKYTSRKGFVEVEGNTVTLFTPSHVQYAAYGRGPGKKPPLENILKWVSHNGILIDGSTERGTAFAIQNSISKKGTKNWKPNAPNVIQEAINNELSKYSEDLAKFFSIEVADEMNKIVKKKDFLEIKISI